MNGDKRRKNIILTGFMGTGKTTVGKRLAKRLGYRFVDTDHLIEANHGKTIAKIFAEEGEAVFRRLEQETAAALAKDEQLLISTGGRMLLDPINAAALGETGLIICLTATPETIIARVTGDGQVDTRPLLAGDDPEGRIRQLLQERAAGYGRFTQVQTDGLGPEQVVDRIVALIGE